MLGSLNDGKKKTIVNIAAAFGIFGAILAALFVLPLGDNGLPTIPWIRIGTDGEPVNPDHEANTVTGRIAYDLRLNYVDGSHDTFSEVATLPSLPLGDLFTGGGPQTSGSKQISDIVLTATARVNIPQSLPQGHTIGETVYSESTAKVFLDGTQIDSKSYSTFYPQASAGSDHVLYSLTIPASGFVVPTGTYTLKVESSDRIRLSVDGQDRELAVQAKPELGLQGLKPVYVVTYRPSAAATLVQEPLYTYHACGTPENPTGTCASLYAYNWFVTVVGSGFTAGSGVFFDYTENSYYSKTAGMPLYSDKNLTAGADGRVIDKTFIKTGISALECNRYGSTLVLSQGQLATDPITIGCLYRP